MAFVERLFSTQTVHLGLVCPGNYIVLDYLSSGMAVKRVSMVTICTEGGVEYLLFLANINFVL